MDGVTTCYPIASMTRHFLTVTLGYTVVAVVGLFAACKSRTPAPEIEAIIADASKEAPATLAEAHARLDEKLSAEDKQKIAQGTERDMINYHFGLGMWIRNNLGLWQGGPLAQHLKEFGLTHPDDMSGVVLDTYWCHLKGRTYSISNRVAYYDAYWQGMKAAEEKAAQSGSKTSFTPNLPDPAPLCPDPAP